MLGVQCEELLTWLPKDLHPIGPKLTIRIPVQSPTEPIRVTDPTHTVNHGCQRNFQLTKTKHADSAPVVTQCVSRPSHHPCAGPTFQLPSNIRVKTNTRAMVSPSAPPISTPRGVVPFKITSLDTTKKTRKGETKKKDKRDRDR